jgi:hypothetical protein
MLSRSVAVAVCSSICVLLPLDPSKVIVEAAEARLPQAPVLINPVGDVFQGGGLQTARAPLGFTSPRDEPGPFEHFEVLGDGGKAHLERLGEFGDRGLPRGESRQDGSARRIGQRRERPIQQVSGHM